MKALVHILVIDDDANLRRTLALILEHAGYCVTSSASAREGLCCLDKQAFDLIFLDIVMPEMDGLELLPQLRQRYPHIPIMILTGNILPDANAETWPTGVRGFLSKPVDPDHILSRVSELMGDKMAGQTQP